MALTDRPVARTEYGLVRGIALPELEHFIEVPYGAETSGARRFKPAQPPEPWSGIRDAGAWTTRTAQYPDGSPIREPRQWFAVQGAPYAAGQGEDSLTLNIWTPSSRDDARRPVVVWLHGGGWIVGQAAQHMSDGAAFAREHDAVFVSITHRLNAFGFLPLDRIGGPEFRGSGNQGLLDIVAGLRWIRDNIRDFGGDPGSVTVVGESGGGGKTSALLVMPEAEGLLHRAVCLSGVVLEVRDRADSEAYARRLIEHLGGSDVGALVDATTQEILDAQIEIERDPAVPRLGPVVDGDVLPAAPVDVWRSGGGSAIPVIAGAQHDEVTIFGGPDRDLHVDLPPGFPPPGDGGSDPFDFDAGFATAAALAGVDVGPAVDAVRELRAGITDRDATIALVGDLMFRYPTAVFAGLRAAGGRSTWVFQLDWASPELADLGAPHSSSVGLFFGNDRLLHFLRDVPAGERLARRMSGALAAFMRTGAPGHADLPAWPRYDLDRRSVMVFDDPSRVVDDPDGALREAFDRIRPRLLH